MELKKIRLLGYYSSPNQKMNPETEKIEEANALAPLLESSIESLLNNPGTDSELKKTLSIPSVFVFKDETGGLYGLLYEFADTSLLPDDFDKRSPDNMILSVALKYREDNPIMLTSDNGLQLKCKIFNIATVSLRNFLKR